MIQGNSPGHWLPDIKRFVRPIDGFDAPDIADPLKPGERPHDFEIPTKPDFDRPIKPKVEHELFLALADPHASLIDIANEFEISLEALSEWLTRPDVAARMESIASASVVRARFVAKSFLPAAARSAGRILALHQIFRRHNPKSMAGDDHNDRRFDKTAMQASATLLRIAAFGQPPPKANVKSAKPEEAPVRESSAPASTVQPPIPSPPPAPAPIREGNSESAIGASCKMDDQSALPPTPSFGEGASERCTFGA